jgi:hypothetical protein
VPNVNGQSPPSGRHIRAEEMDRLFAYLDALDTPTAARDRAAFAILRAPGSRGYARTAGTGPSWHG